MDKNNFQWLYNNNLLYHQIEKTFYLQINYHFSVYIIIDLSSKLKIPQKWRYPF